jgi:hypothetical protein
MGLFPPLAEEHWRHSGILSSGTKLDSRFIGYGFLFGDPSPNREVYTVEYHIDWSVLLAQWLVVAVMTWAAMRFLRSGRAPAETVLESVGRLLGPTLLGVGLLMILAGCGGFGSTPLLSREYFGPPPGFYCGVLGIPLALLEGGICIGRSIGRGGR